MFEITILIGLAINAVIRKWKDACRNMIEIRLVNSLKILNMESIYFKTHEIIFWVFWIFSGLGSIA